MIVLGVALVHAVLDAWSSMRCIGEPLLDAARGRLWKTGRFRRPRARLRPDECVSMMPVPRPVKRPWMACAYCRFGFIRVASSTNQARRWSGGVIGVALLVGDFPGGGERGHCTLSRIRKLRCSTKLSGFVMPSRWM